MKRLCRWTVLLSLIGPGCDDERFSENRHGDRDVEEEQALPQDPGVLDEAPDPIDDALGNDDVPAEFGGAASSPAITVDGHGGAFALWTQSRDEVPRYSLWASHYEPSIGWQESFQLTDWRVSAFEVATAGNAAGRLVVAWNVTGGVAARYYEPESGWEPTATVAPSSDSGWTSTIRAVMNDAGDALIAWTSYEVPAVTLWSALYQPSANWLTPVALEPDGTASFDLFDIAIDDAGRCLSVWAEANTNRVQARRGSQVAGSLGPLSWGAAELVGSYPEEGTYGLMTLGAALDTTGAATVVWVEHTQDAGLTLVSTRGPLGMSFGAREVVVSEIPASFGLETNEPRIASNMGGDVVVLWRESAQTWEEDPEPSSIVGVRYSPDAGWSAASAVAEGLSTPYWGCAMSSAGHMTVALDESGNAKILFESRGDGDGVNSFDVELWTTNVSRFGIAAPRVLLTPSAVPYSAVLAVGAAGDALAFWTRNEELPDGVWTQSVEASYIAAD